MVDAFILDTGCGTYGAGRALAAYACQSRPANQGWALISATPVLPLPSRSAGVSSNSPRIRSRSDCKCRLGNVGEGTVKVQVEQCGCGECQSAGWAMRLRGVSKCRLGNAAEGSVKVQVGQCG
eukprot:352813-Chlamydomonas_euryale.AAC.4